MMPSSTRSGPFSWQARSRREDRCYVGSSPGLIYGGCHGDDEKAVFDELCRIVEDAIELAKRMKQDNAFVTRVLAQPKLWIIGDERGLAA
jgi:hypothetical protein